MNQDIINEYKKRILAGKPDNTTPPLNCKCFRKEDFTAEFYKFAGLISNHSIRLFTTADFIFLWVADNCEVPVLTSIK